MWWKFITMQSVYFYCGSIFFSIESNKEIEESGNGRNKMEEMTLRIRFQSIHKMDLVWPLSICPESQILFVYPLAQNPILFLIKSSLFLIGLSNPFHMWHVFCPFLFLFSSFFSRSTIKVIFLFFFSVGVSACCLHKCQSSLIFSWIESAAFFFFLNSRCRFLGVNYFRHFIKISLHILSTS